MIGKAFSGIDDRLDDERHEGQLGAVPLLEALLDPVARAMLVKSTSKKVVTCAEVRRLLSIFSAIRRRMAVSGSTSDPLPGRA
jgi:hypothetical protein